MKDLFEYRNHGRLSEPAYPWTNTEDRIEYLPVPAAAAAADDTVTQKILTLVEAPGSERDARMCDLWLEQYLKGQP